MNKLVSLCTNFKNGNTQLYSVYLEFQELIDWLESLKERVQPQPKYQWKPSKEQMEALNAINNIGELFYVEQSDLLVKLYNDLKKL